MELLPASAIEENSVSAADYSAQVNGDGRNIPTYSPTKLSSRGDGRGGSRDGGPGNSHGVVVTVEEADVAIELPLSTISSSHPAAGCFSLLREVYTKLYGAAAGASLRSSALGAGTGAGAGCRTP